MRPPFSSSLCTALCLDRHCTFRLNVRRTFDPKSSFHFPFFFSFFNEIRRWTVNVLTLTHHCPLTFFFPLSPGSVCCVFRTLLLIRGWICPIFVGIQDHYR
ncbi:hypothetical protein V8C34DRAFT_121049 [Trichoderma compactum]